MSLRVFGYGSLVNRGTHDYEDARPATLTGWRRVWRHAVLRPVAFLSVEPCPGAQIAGLTASVPAAAQSALKDRERAYETRDVTAAIHGEATPTYLFEIAGQLLEPPSVAHPILLSYIDVVVQGYLHLGGPTAVGAFAETTAGWHAPVLDDRAAPLYPRAQTLEDGERRMVDDLLVQMGSDVRPPETYDLSRLGQA